MTKRRRWIESAIREAAKTTTPMPWERGARRTAWIVKRDGKDAAHKKSA